MKKLYTVIVFFIGVFYLNAQFTYTYTGKPRFQILTKQNGDTLGIINVELFPRIAPLHVRNFDSLVSKQFYDSSAFHRVVPGFVIQGGDPNSKSGPVSTWGFGQPWQPKVNAEFSVAQHLRGILSAARSSNINSATSQFFICVAAAPSLNGQYSVYGRVTSGMSVVDQIVSTPTVSGTQRPVDKVEMFVTYIGSNDTVPANPVLSAPKYDSLNVDTTSLIMKWAKVQDAVFYHLDVSLDSLFQKDTIRSVDLPGLQYTLFPLTSDTVYYWRVKANNGGHISTSPTWRFRTEPKPSFTHHLEPIKVLNTHCDSLRIAIEAQFPFGAGWACPDLTGFTLANNNGMLEADLYYDISGSWPMLGCQQRDTLIAIVSPESFIQVRSHSIFEGDTTFAVTDTIVSYCATMGVDKMRNSGISVFPNPLGDSFTIYTGELQSVVIKVHLYDARGKEVYVNHEVVGDKIMIDAQHLPPGLFTVSLIDANGRNTRTRVMVIK